MKYDAGDEFEFVVQRLLDEQNEWKIAIYNNYDKERIQKYLLYCKYILSDIGKHNSFKPGSFTRKKTGLSFNEPDAISCNFSDIDIDFRLDSNRNPVFMARNDATGAVLFDGLNSGLYGSSQDINGCYFFKQNGEIIEIKYYDKEAVDAVKSLLKGKDMTVNNFSAYGISPDEQVFCPLNDFSFGEFLRDSDYFDKLVPSLLEIEKNQGKAR